MTIATKNKPLLHHNVRTLRIVRFFRIICFQIIRNFREKNKASNSVTKLRKINKKKKEKKGKKERKRERNREENNQEKGKLQQQKWSDKK